MVLDLLASWPEIVVLRRRWLLAFWVIVASVLVPLAAGSSARLEIGGAEARESESVWVDRALKQQFGSPFARNAVLVLEGIDPQDSAGRVAMRDIEATLLEDENVLRVVSYINAPDSVFLSPRGTFILVGVSDKTPSDDEMVTQLRSITARLQPELERTHPAGRMWWTGAAAFNYDIRLASGRDAAAAERRVLPVTLIALFIIFGSVLAALLPIAVGGLAIALSLGAAFVISGYWPLVILLQNIVSMLGLGLGVDYALLIVTRFREEVSRGSETVAAAVLATKHAGSTVLLSGTAVAIGFAPLLIVPATELRSVAVGGLLVVLFAVLAATTLLPGILVFIGRRLEAGRVWRSGKRGGGSSWRIWGRWVVAHPVITLLVAGAPLVMLAWNARRLSTDIPSGPWLPRSMESTKGALALQTMGKSGVIQTLRVVILFPERGAATTDEGWAATTAMAQHLERDSRTARVKSLPMVLNATRPSASLMSFVTPDMRNAFMSRDERMALIEVEPRHDVSTGDLMRFARELREIDVRAVTGFAGSQIKVGGLPALNADYQTAIGGSVISVVLLVVGGTFVALLAGFRSFLVPIKAIALNLLSVAAAMGATVLVFQDGYGLGLFGLDSPVDGLFPAVPTIVFCIVFGLSMDYEVFLVARVREAVASGLSGDDAVVAGLVGTAGVITSAAAVMVIVFSGFAMGDFLIIKIIGFALSVAVVLDATLVRMAVGPATLKLAGRWNWWPGLKSPHAPRRPDLEDVA